MVGRTAELDRSIGERVRMARLMKGISQGALAAELGISFQQVQKYERGTNRVSASTLLKIAEVLGVDVLYFYDGLLPTVISPAPLDLSAAMAIDFDILRSVMKIRNAKTKRSIADLVAALEDQALSSDT